MKIGKKDYHYVHLNDKENYVIFLGFFVKNLINSFGQLPHNLLLMEHQFTGIASFDLNTRFNYLSESRFSKYLKKSDEEFGCFSWIDFVDSESLDEIGQWELAELLYLNHTKQHIRLPFYQRLENNFVFLSEENSSFKKIYFRHWQDFYRILSNIFSEGMDEAQAERTFFGTRKSVTIEKMPIEIIKELLPLLKEGIAFSTANIFRSRNGLELPIWIVGDFRHESELIDEAEKILKKEADTKVKLSKKTNNWEIEILST